MHKSSAVPSAINGFLNSVRKFPTHLALSVAGQTLTYLELQQKASQLAAVLTIEGEVTSELVAIFAYRSISAYAAVIATHFCRRGYLPLNPHFPSERNLQMLQLAETDTLIVADECLCELETFLAQVNRPLHIVLADREPGDLPKRFPQHQFTCPPESTVATPEDLTLPEGSLAYVLFTSGSTGTPKGVMITHANLNAYVHNIRLRYHPTPNDRFSQVHDFTFDPSAHDMFSAWTSSACLCTVPKASMMGPAKFIREQEITFWYSVPSVAGFMSRLKMLAPDSFPKLRVTLFCGEPLPAGIAEAWQQAAPQSIVDNLYGPTEATVSITAYRWSKSSMRDCENGIVPIGKPLVEQKVMRIDEALHVTQGSGELCLAGSQLSPGYWRDPQKTRERFVTLNGETWYRTGDLCEEKNGDLYFLGRLDHQVKIRGYRVELQEIEFQLKKITGADEVVALAWPMRNGSADGILAFVVAPNDTNTSPQAWLEQCKTTLPEYMLPTRIHRLEKLPLNANGKIDRKQLTEGLKP